MSIPCWILDEHIGQTIFGQVISSTTSAILALGIIWAWRTSLSISRKRKLNRLVELWDEGLRIKMRYRPAFQDWTNAWNDWQERLGRGYRAISPRLARVMEVDFNKLLDENRYWLGTPINDQMRSEADKIVMSAKLDDLKEYLKQNIAV
jgi:hypothetical protein